MGALPRLLLWEESGGSDGGSGAVALELEKSGVAAAFQDVLEISE